MKLPIGARLPHDFADIPTNEPEVVQRNRALYRVTHVLSETPWSCLYRGKKIFRNFEFSKGTLIEAADDECLDVLIRTLSYPRTDDREYIKLRREHLWFEAKQVLGFGSTNLIAEPLDYLEVRNDQDQFAFSRPGKIPTTEPVLVFETIHGDNLARWRQSTQIDSMTSLHLLGQMLEFLATLHQAKFLLNVVSPAAFWVDSLSRVHFLGTENVVDDRRAVKWRTLFPNERYSQGFVSPELLQPNVPPSNQSDLYGWAALAWFLLTGDSPAKMAADQQQRWARFESSHRERLHYELEQFSPLQVAEVKRELNITGSRFEALWPNGFLEGIWSCLDQDPVLRPGSVADLRTRWGNPPPPPVAACLAVKQANGSFRFAFSNTGLRAGMQVQITRKAGQAPRSKEDGETVWIGDATHQVGSQQSNMHSPRGTPPVATWCFSAFALEPIDQNTTVSRPTLAICLDQSVPHFRRIWAESLSGNIGSLPEEVTLLSEFDRVDVIAAELLGSSQPLVRSWAIALLERTLRANPADVSCRKLLHDRGLVDDDNAICQRAASALIRTSARVDVSLVVDLAQCIGGQAVDDMIRAARGFVPFGVSAPILEKAIEALEQQHRIVVCPVCQLELRTRELDQHLTTEHHYVPLDGKLIPFGPALTRLWSHVVQRCDESALSTLIGHLQKRHAEGASAAFAAAFSHQVLFAFQSQLAHKTDEQRRNWFENVARCVRSNKTTRLACAELLGHEDGRVRDMARQVCVTASAMRLVDEHVTAGMFRQVVNELAPLPVFAERIETCRRLIDLGANPLAGELCQQELDLERLIDCPECGTTFAKRDLPRHRRSEHRVFEWDGQRYDWETLVPVLLSRTVAVEPDAFAARSLTELFVEQYGNGAWERLYQGIRNQLLTVAEHEDDHALVSGLGAAVGALPQASKLSRAFLKEDHFRCQAAGLAIFTNLDRDPSVELSLQAASLLGQANIPLAVCQQVVIYFLRRSTIDTELCRRALMALASRAANKLEGVEILRTLEQWVGASTVIETACEELISQIRMRCPRCDIVLTPPELAEHVRTGHGLILEGRSIRQPWSVVMDYLDEYAETPKDELLERAEQLVDLVSPKKGRPKLWRETLRRGIAPDHYRRALVESVQNSSNSLCPECWESLPTDDSPLTPVSIDDRGEIQSENISLKRVGLHRIWASVEITPWDGTDPQWTLSRLGAVMAVGFLFLVAAAACGFLSWHGLAGAKPVVFVSLAGGMLAVALFYWPRVVEPLDVAWDLVVPGFLDDPEIPFGPSRSEFVASLAHASCGHGNLRSRQPRLNRAIDFVQDQVRQGNLPGRHLAELWRLRFDDATHLLKQRHGPREVVLKELLTRFLKGELSLDFVTGGGATLGRFHQDELVTAVWHIVEQARLGGFVTADLVEMFRKSSTLKMLAKATSIQPDALPYFFAILEMEQTGRIPYGVVSARQSISLGKYSSITNYPSLLAQFEPNLLNLDQDAILLRPGTLEFRTRRFTSLPDVTVREKRQFIQTGWTHQRADGGPDLRYASNPPVGHEKVLSYTLNVGSYSWDRKSNPELLAAKIRKASNFLFGELQLQADKLTQGPTSAKLPRILEGPGASCPRCHTSLRLKKGGVAMRIVETS